MGRRLSVSGVFLRRRQADTLEELVAANIIPAAMPYIVATNPKIGWIAIEASLPNHLVRLLADLANKVATTEPAHLVLNPGDAVEARHESPETRKRR